MMRKQFVSVSYDATIYDAVVKLTSNFIHRMPITKSKANAKSIVGILNFSKILRFLMQKMESKYRTSIDLSVSEMGFDFTKKYPPLKKTDSLLVALRFFSQFKRVAALPIVDSHGVVLNAFMRSDIRFFAVDRLYLTLEIPCWQFIEKHAVWCPPPFHPRTLSFFMPFE